MALKSKDIIPVQCQTSWFEAGLNYALISWTSTFNRMQSSNPYARIERIILGIIAECGFEDYLKREKILYDTQGKTRWYEVDRYDIGVGIDEYAVDVKSNFINVSTTYIQERFPDTIDDMCKWFLGCQALVPLDQFNPGDNRSRKHNREKIYVFPFLKGYFAEEECNKYLVHAMWDYAWLKKGDYKDGPQLGRLKIRYSGAEKGKIKIFGTTSKNKAITEVVDLSTGTALTQNNFYQVFSILWIGNGLPDSTISILAIETKLKEKIGPYRRFEIIRTDDGFLPVQNDWQSLELCDSMLFLAGWQHEDDLRVDGKKYPRFCKDIKQYAEIKVDNWGVDVEDLNPLNELKSL